MAIIMAIFKDFLKIISNIVIIKNKKLKGVKYER